VKSNEARHVGKALKYPRELEGTLIEIFTGENWKAEVFESYQLVLVDFQAPGYARYFLEELRAENFIEKWGTIVRIGSLDATRFTDVAFLNRVIELPTLALFDCGRVLKAFRGPTRVREMAHHVFTYAGLKEIGILSD
jgi:thioredoxin-like negative regulator of GroEL